MAFQSFQQISKVSCIVLYLNSIVLQRCLIHLRFDVSNCKANLKQCSIKICYIHYNNYVYMYMCMCMCVHIFQLQQLDSLKLSRWQKQFKKIQYKMDTTTGNKHNQTLPISLLHGHLFIIAQTAKSAGAPHVPSPPPLSFDIFVPPSQNHTTLIHYAYTYTHCQQLHV